MVAVRALRPGGRPGLEPHASGCARRSGRPTTWPPTWSAATRPTRPTTCSTCPSPSTRPTGPWCGSRRGVERPSRSAWPGRRPRRPASGATSRSTAPLRAADERGAGSHGARRDGDRDRAGPACARATSSASASAPRWPCCRSPGATERAVGSSVVDDATGGRVSLRHRRLRRAAPASAGASSCPRPFTPEQPGLPARGGRRARAGAGSAPHRDAAAATTPDRRRAAALERPPVPPAPTATATCGPLTSWSGLGASWPTSTRRIGPHGVAGPAVRPGARGSSRPGGTSTGGRSPSGASCSAGIYHECDLLRRRGARPPGLLDDLDPPRWPGWRRASPTSTAARRPPPPPWFPSGRRAGPRRASSSASPTSCAADEDGGRPAAHPRRPTPASSPWPTPGPRASARRRCSTTRSSPAATSSATSSSSSTSLRQIGDVAPDPTTAPAARRRPTRSSGAWWRRRRSSTAGDDESVAADAGRGGDARCPTCRDHPEGRDWGEPGAPAGRRRGRALRRRGPGAS